MENSDKKYISIVTMLKHFGVLKDWWDKSDNQIAFAEDTGVFNIIFSRFAVKNYLEELNTNSKTDLDNKILEVLRVNFPILKNENIYFCDSEKLSKEIYNDIKVKKSILKYKI